MPKALTKKNKNDIDESLKMLSSMEGELKRAEAAGLDVGDLIARRANVKKRLSQIRATYFPGE